MIKQLRGLAITIVAIAWVGGLVWNFSNFGDPNRYKQDILFFLTAFSVSVVTFFGILLLNSSKDINPLNKEIFRTAIAACILITYLFIFCYYISFKSENLLGTVTRSLLDTFTNLVSVTIAFYLGTSAAVQIFAKKENDEGVEAKK